MQLSFHLLDILVYVVLVALGLHGWLAGRDARASLTFAAACGALLASTVLAFGYDAPLTGSSEITLARLALVLDCWFPALMLVLQHQLGGLRRTWLMVFLALAAASSALALLGPATPHEPFRQGAGGIALAALVGSSFFGGLAVSFAGFIRFGIGRPGIVKRRMWTMGTGVLVLMLTAVAAAAFDLGVATPELRIPGIVAGVLLGLGFRPPGWLRELWRRDEREELRRSFLRFLEATSERDALEAVLPPFVDLLGVQGVIMFSRSGEVLLERGIAAGRVAELVALAGRLQPDVASTQHGEAIIVRSGEVTTIVLLATATPLFGSEEVGIVQAVAAFAELALQRGRSMDELRERDGQLRAAQEIGAMGSWEFDIDADRVHVSPALAGLLGLDVGDATLSSAQMLELVHADDRAELQALIDAVISGGEPFLHDHRIVRSDGTQLFVHSRGQLRAGGRRRRRVTGIVQDITERKLGEEHLRSMFERERELTRRLTTVDNVKNNILAAVSHELRTPLTSVIGFALTLRDRDELLEPGARREIIGHLAGEALRLQQLLGDLLDLDRLQRGVVAPRLAPMHVPELVERVLQSLPNGAAVEVDVHDVTAMLDGAKMDRVLANLVQNALRHTPEGTSVTIRGRAEGDALRIEVVDDGQGVPIEHRDRIFLPFDRGGAELDHAPGTGIGLAIVRQFVELHGGRSWVEDAPSGGARFIVELPLSGPGAPA